MSFTSKALLILARHNVLLTSLQDIQARRTDEDLAAYGNAIENVVDVFFTPLERRISCELTIQFALTAAGHEVLFIAVPDLSVDVAEDLHQRLESVPLPKVGGPVKFERAIYLALELDRSWTENDG